MEKEVTKESEANTKEFLAEAEEIVESLNSDLMRLAGSGKAEPALLNNIFRAAHTLKGLSGMFGFDALTSLGHNLENLLDSLRLGKIELSPYIIDLLFEGISTIHMLLEMKSQGKEDISVKAIIDKINSAVSDQGKNSASDATPKIDPSIMNVLTEYEEHRLNESVKSGSNIFKVQSSFPIMSFDVGLADLTAILKEKGEIITTLPTPGFSPGDTINFDIIIATQISQEALEGIIDNREVKVSLAMKTAKDLPVPDIEKVQSEIKLPSMDEQQMKVEDKSADEGVKSITHSVRVDISKLDNLMNIVGEAVMLKASIGGIAEKLKSRDGSAGLAGELSKTVKILEKRLYELQQGVLESRMVPLGQVFDKLSRTVRKLGREIGKEVDFVVNGADTELDKHIVEELANPLIHILRNSLDHGIEPLEERRRAGKKEKGLIKVSASQKGSHVVVTVEDDGKGIDLDTVLRKAVERGLAEKGATLKRDQILDFMFLPGFSTKEEVSEISGRGVGMDVVKKNITDLSGMVEIDTEKGRGTKVMLILPMTLAIVKALIVEVTGSVYAIPLTAVLENFILEPSRIETIETSEFVYLRDATLPLIRLCNYFHLSTKCEIGKFVVVVGLAEKRLGLIVDGLRGQQDIVMKSVGKRLEEVKGIAGATDIGQKTILVLDIGDIMDECMKGHSSQNLARG